MATLKKTGAAVTGGSSFSIGDAVKALSDPKTRDILGGVYGFLRSLFGGGGKLVQPPTTPITKPVPTGFPDDDFIPAPPNTEDREVVRVECKISRVQLQKARFPDAYENGKDGLVEGEALRDINSGQTPMNYGSKFWVDLTAYDRAGKELYRDAVIALSLQYRTEHHAGDAYIVGNGGQPGAPKPGYKTNDTDLVGNGITAWTSSMGFLHQFKSHAEGNFEVWGSVDGVESNRLNIRVS